MILWNTSKSELIERYDGIAFVFQPGEKKGLRDCMRIIDEAFKAKPDLPKPSVDVAMNHLLLKLESYGMIGYDEESTPEQIQAAYIQGLRNRRKMLDKRIRAFRTMNKEREAKNWTAEQPDQIIIDTVKEIKVIDQELGSICKEDLELVSDYLKTDEVIETEENIDKLNQKIEVTADNRAVLTGKSTLADKGKQGKNRVNKHAPTPAGN